MARALEDEGEAILKAILDMRYKEVLKRRLDEAVAESEAKKPRKN